MTFLRTPFPTAALSSFVCVSCTQGQPGGPFGFGERYDPTEQGALVSRRAKTRCNQELRRAATRSRAAPPPAIPPRAQCPRPVVHARLRAVAKPWSHRSSAAWLAMPTTTGRCQASPEGDLHVQWRLYGDGPRPLAGMSASLGAQQNSRKLFIWSRKSSFKWLAMVWTVVVTVGPWCWHGCSVAGSALQFAVYLPPTCRDWRTRR